MLLLIAMCLMLFNMAEGMSTMYVTPNVTTNQCPGTPCLELNTYVHNVSSYFLSTSEFIFLPGTHFLDSNVMVANKDNLQMIGSPNLTQYPISVKVQEYGFDSYDEDNNVTYLESSTNITCTSYNNTGFVFVNVTNLTIINITFVNCGVYFNLTGQSAGIHMVKVHNLQMEGVSIQNSTGYGLLGVNLLGHSQIMKSSFIGNNQFIKNGLNRQGANNFKCNGKSYANNTLYYGNGDVTLDGGNMVIKYQDYGYYIEANKIKFSALVLDLGIDIFFNESNQCDSDPQLHYQGTGLSFILNQTYYINVTIEDSTFYRNQAWCGANIYVLDLSANFDITIYNVFIIRSMTASGAFYINYINALQPAHSFVHMSRVIFECNYAISDCSSLEIETFGKVFHTSQHALEIILENCTFRSDYSGGSAVLLELTSVITSSFIQCNITDMLQTALALEVVPDGKASFAMNGCIFNDSSIKLRNIAVSITDSTFYNSHITAYGGATITLSGNVTFASSVGATSTNGGAIYLSSATIAFSAQSNVIFVNNSATYGAAIYMENESYLNYSSPTNVTFINNTALLTGGAIYVVTYSPSAYYHMACFYQYDKISDTPLRVHVYFDGNFAGEAGSAIYGGDIDSCLLDYCETCNTKIFDATHHFGYHDNTSSLISSDPRFIYVCPCDKGKCSQASLNKTVYPGETIDVNLITIGQRNGISPGAIFVYTDNTPISFISALRSTNRCGTYHIQYKAINGSLYLATQLSFDSGQADLHHITISVLVFPCPAGFVLDNFNSSCVCDSMLNLYVKNCNIDDQTLFKSGNAWIGDSTQGKLLVVDPCPSDYCTNASKIDVFNFNSQCSNNRVGVACGQCEGNLSMTFGTSQCKLCTNEYLLLIIPYAFMGMALIVFLMMFNFTVSSGTINGIILYAFVLRVYKEIYFPASSGAAAKVLDFLSVFIAWLNLDFGIETCFYNGMDSYSKVWLQFSFPLYMIALVVMIIITSRLSSAMSRICRYNIIPVISTIVTLCYAKSLRIITSIFTFSTLESGSTNVLSMYVWDYDAAIPYLGLKHAFLFTAGSVVTIFFIVPYTALMLLTPCLMSMSHWKVMFWMSKLKPFIDCYEAPFKDRYRFWTGATLFYRIVFCIVFSLFSTKQPTIVLLIIIVVHASMIVLAGLAIYKRWLESLLEGFFHVNIVVYSLALYIQYSFYNKHISAIPAIICVGSAFICFLCILFCAMFHRINRWIHLGHLQYVKINHEDVAAENNEAIAAKKLNTEILDYVDRET